MLAARTEQNVRQPKRKAFAISDIANLRGGLTSTNDATSMAVSLLMARKCSSDERFRGSDVQHPLGAMMPSSPSDDQDRKTPSRARGAWIGGIAITLDDVRKNSLRARIAPESPTGRRFDAHLRDTYNAGLSGA
jgi:hypothetical protein